MTTDLDFSVLDEELSKGVAKLVFSGGAIDWYLDDKYKLTTTYAPSMEELQEFLDEQKNS